MNDKIKYIQKLEILLDCETEKGEEEKEYVKALEYAIWHLDHYPEWVREVNWTLLGSQKQWLLKKVDHSEDSDKALGLVHMIDSIQDWAAKIVGEQTVFPVRKTMECAVGLWKDLGSLLVLDDGTMEEQFLHFPVGTDREDIWRWFESYFGLSVVEDLMFPTLKGRKTPVPLHLFSSIDELKKYLA